jgi:hypothetical protein
MLREECRPFASPKAVFFFFGNEWSKTRQLFFPLRTQLKFVRTFSGARRLSPASSSRSRRRRSDSLVRSWSFSFSEVRRLRSSRPFSRELRLEARSDCQANMR